MQFCPEGESQSKIFRYLFLQRLPAELRIILSEDSDSTLPVLAARVDQLWAHSARRPHDAAVNAVTEDSSQEETTVASVAGQTFGRGGNRGKPRGGRGGGRGGNAAAGSGTATTADKSSPTWLAQQASGLCQHHGRYGDKAFNCHQPCSWQGN